MRRATAAAARIDAVVNTHANGDHCWGNAALPEARIISSRATAVEMAEFSPKLMHALVRGARAIDAAGGIARWPLSLLRRLGVSRAGALLDAAPFVVEVVRRVRLRRSDAAGSDANLRGQARPDHRREGSSPDPGGAGPHAWGHAGLRTCRPDRLHRRHLVHRQPPHHVGRASQELGARVRGPARAGRRRRRARARAADGQVGRPGDARLLGGPGACRPGGPRGGRVRASRSRGRFSPVTRSPSRSESS